MPFVIVAFMGTLKPIAEMPLLLLLFFDPNGIVWEVAVC